MSKAEYKTSKLRNRPDPGAERLTKPRWIKAKTLAPSAVGRIARIKKLLRDHNLYSVCEEASCPNLSECFGNGTATFMIMGGICTRKCPFCDVAHGRPEPLDADEPLRLASAIADLGLRYVVITSVDRDDLRDGGAEHFATCVVEVRKCDPDIRIEVLVPDFRGCQARALAEWAVALPDVFNHNLETVPRIYDTTRPGASYEQSLRLLGDFKQLYPGVLTKSGVMLGLGETMDELLEVMEHMRRYDIDMLTLGQYLQPSKFHLPVVRYVTPDEFSWLEGKGYEMGFTKVASGPMVRSSYHADVQAHQA